MKLSKFTNTYNTKGEVKEIDTIWVLSAAILNATTVPTSLLVFSTSGFQSFTSVFVILEHEGLGKEDTACSKMCITIILLYSIRGEHFARLETVKWVPNIRRREQITQEESKEQITQHDVYHKPRDALLAE